MLANVHVTKWSLRDWECSTREPPFCSLCITKYFVPIRDCLKDSFEGTREKSTCSETLKLGFGWEKRRGDAIQNIIRNERTSFMRVSTAFLTKRSYFFLNVSLFCRIIKIKMSRQMTGHLIGSIFRRECITLDELSDKTVSEVGDPGYSLLLSSYCP